MSLPVVAPQDSRMRVSFEFFPPKTEKAEKTLWESLDVLAPLAPAFVSVTYGAGGTTRARTHEIVTAIQKKKSIAAAAHLTCVGATREEIDAIAKEYWEAGIRHIVALRGDMPDMGTGYVPTPGGYAYALDLVEGLKKVAPFEISVAGYPEGHPESPGLKDDLDFLKRKVDAGADRVITQFFLDPEKFLSFRDRAAAAGITVPLVPGMLPITNFGKAVEFAGKCNANVPQWMHDLFEGLDDEPKTRQLVAATVAAAQCRRLCDEGVEDFHFYTLNRAELTRAICHMLGMRIKAVAAEKAVCG
ncbi:MAG: methylenetetrahydrofolate reductase [NAD(P)H] [Alphaproteobacteria bacterium]|nr:methylenetetrahydrofolate reductase [NAD(P)H] [Alphaproteobacteria bacterium]